LRAKAAALDWSLTEHVGRHRRHGMVLARELRVRTPPE
jgi:hypothetical protein